jgi:hypothetical protein
MGIISAKQIDPGSRKQEHLLVNGNLLYDEITSGPRGVRRHPENVKGDKLKAKSCHAELEATPMSEFFSLSNIVGKHGHSQYSDDATEYTATSELYSGFVYSIYIPTYRQLRSFKNGVETY